MSDKAALWAESAACVQPLPGKPLFLPLPQNEFAYIATTNRVKSTERKNNNI